MSYHQILVRERSLLILKCFALTLKHPNLIGQDAENIVKERILHWLDSRGCD